MKCKVSNWMVLSVSNNKGFVTRGYYITKKSFRHMKMRENTC